MVERDMPVKLTELQMLFHNQTTAAYDVPEFIFKKKKVSDMYPEQRRVVADYDIMTEVYNFYSLQVKIVLAKGAQNLNM